MMLEDTLLAHAGRTPLPDLRLLRLLLILPAPFSWCPSLLCCSFLLYVVSDGGFSFFEYSWFCTSLEESYGFFG